MNRALTGAMFVWAVGGSQQSWSVVSGLTIAAIVFSFFTVLAILPLLFVHESRALRYVGNRVFFLFASVSQREVRSI